MVKKYDVVIIPTPEVTRSACEISRLVTSRYDTRFVLDEIDRVPHLSLYHFAALEERLPEIIEAIKIVARFQAPLILTATGYHRENLPWLGVLYKKDASLLKLHQDVLGAVSPFHDKRKHYDQTEEWSDTSPIRQENLRLYGWSEADSLYRPHITITRFDTDLDPQDIDELPVLNGSFEATTLGLYELGEYGTCKNIVATCTLGEKLL